MLAVLTRGFGEPRSDRRYGLTANYDIAVIGAGFAGFAGLACAARPSAASP